MALSEVRVPPFYGASKNRVNPRLPPELNRFPILSHLLPSFLLQPTTLKKKESWAFFIDHRTTAPFQRVPKWKHFDLHFIKICVHPRWSLAIWNQLSLQCLLPFHTSIQSLRSLRSLAVAISISWARASLSPSVPMAFTATAACPQGEHNTTHLHNLHTKLQE